MLYKDYLKKLLAPLELYSLDGGPSGWELDAVGSELDAINTVIAELERECVPTTATGYGLDKYEELLPQRPMYRNTETRRNALCALISIDDGAFTADDMRRTLAGCGIAASVAETNTHYTVVVSFPGTRGVPEDIDELKTRIESILPCHLQVNYSFTFLTWQELAASDLTWTDAGEMTWAELESFEP